MKKKLIISLGVVFLIAAIISFSYYRKIYQKNVTETTSIYIPSDTDFEKLVTIVKPHLSNVKSFVWVAEKKKYTKKIRAGKFRITEGMNNNNLVNHLRGGKQETIKLTFNNQDDFNKLAGRVAAQIEADSLSLLIAMNDTEFLGKNGFNSTTALAMYIPNSYEFYWNTDAHKFRDKMLVEYKKFWNESRINKAEQQNLKPLQVSTLASIVQKETAVIAEIRKLMSAISRKGQLYHWRIHSGSEVDLLMERDGVIYPIEIKLKSQPSRKDTRGMRALRERNPKQKIAPGLIISPSAIFEKVAEDDYAMPWDLY